MFYVNERYPIGSSESDLKLGKVSIVKEAARMQDIIAKQEKYNIHVDKKWHA